jgi:hypothetical protein
VLADANRCSRASRVLLHIRKTLLNDSKERDLLFPGKPSEITRGFNDDTDVAAFRKPLGIPLNGRRHPHFVQCGGMQQVR